ncbi:MAG: hypothetical protein B6242_04605 [Anaerolineaceae bacterium 4572_78]|nr:MAG: hypothetical protein B6242_04605 [Anaerolineaceae bacterium 4572_78]
MRFGLRVKLFFAFSFILFFTIIISVASIHNLKIIADELHDIITITEPTVKEVDNLIVNLWQISYISQKIVATDNLSEVDKLEQSIADSRKEFDESFEKLEILVTDDEWKSQLDQVQQNKTDFDNNFQAIITAHREWISCREKTVELLETYDSLDHELETMLSENDSIFATRLESVLIDMEETLSKTLNQKHLHESQNGWLYFNSLQEKANEYITQINNDGVQRLFVELQTIVSGESGILALHELQLEKHSKAHSSLTRMEDNVEDSIVTLNTVLENVSDENEAAGKDVEKRVIQAKLIIIGVTITSVLIGLIMAFLLSLRINDAVSRMIKAASQIATDLMSLARATAALAQGDLSQSIIIRTEPIIYNNDDEIGDFAQVFNEMILRLSETCESFDEMTHSLRLLIGQIVEGANDIGEASEQLSATSSLTEEATDKVTSGIHEITEGSTKQTHSMNQTKDTVVQMSRAIENVASGAQEQASSIGRSVMITNQITSAIQQVLTSAQNGSFSSSEAQKAAHEGAEVVKHTVEDMKHIKREVDFVAEKVHEMGSHSSQIGQIVETIDTIASQTNLLALNAAIEAARVGEQGKGFAVVADSIRKLSERSTIATQEISKLIDEIQRTIKEAVKATEKGTVEVELGVNRANQAGEALEIILEAVETVNIQMEEISSASQEMEQSSSQLADAMDSVSAVVEENTASTQEMSANSDEFTHAIDTIIEVNQQNRSITQQVAKTAEELQIQMEQLDQATKLLKQMSENSRDMVSKFKLSDTYSNMTDEQVSYFEY